LIWTIVSGLATDPFVATNSDGNGRMVSSDIQSIRRRLLWAGFTRSEPKPGDSLILVDIWTKPDSIGHRGPLVRLYVMGSPTRG
jgi:hypothetical protein